MLAYSHESMHAFDNKTVRKEFIGHHGSDAGETKASSKQVHYSRWKLPIVRPIGNDGAEGTNPQARDGCAYGTPFVAPARDADGVDRGPHQANLAGTGNLFPVARRTRRKAVQGL